MYAAVYWHLLDTGRDIQQLNNVWLSRKVETNVRRESARQGLNIDQILCLNKSMHAIHVLQCAHYSDVTCASWRLKSPTTSLLNRLFMLTANEHQSSVLFTLCERKPPGIVESPLKGPMIRKAIPCFGGFMLVASQHSQSPLWRIVAPHGDIKLCQHWLREWLVAWWHEAITWTNADISSVSSISNHHFTRYISATKYQINLKITYLKIQSNLPGLMG